MYLKGISRWVVGCGVLALLLGFATFAEAFPTFDLARAPGGPGYDTIAPPPPPPPPDIRGVPGPPPEVRPGSQMDEIRRIAPPEDLQKGAGETPGAQGEQAGVAGKAVAAPELAVVTVGVSNSTPRVGERVFVTATLKNTGSRSLSGVKVRFFLGQVQVGEKVVEVAAGGSATASISFAAAQAGAQNLRVQADPGAGIAPLTLARGFTVTGAAKTDVEDFTTPAKKGTVTTATGASGGQAPLSPQQIPFDKPLLAKKGTELARQPGGGTSPPGSPPGSRLPGFKDPTGGLGEPQGAPDTTPWGSSVVGKADLRDGIMGKDDQDGMPPTGLGEGVPEKPGFKFPGPDKGGPDAGYYGGVSPKYNPDGAAAGGKKGGKGEYYDEKAKVVPAAVIPLGGSRDPAEKMNDSGATEVFKSKDGRTVIGFFGDSDDDAVLIKVEGSPVAVKSVAEARLVYNLLPGREEKSNFTTVYYLGFEIIGETPRPDGASTKADPRQDPKLILKLTRLVDKQQKGDSSRPDVVLSDPVPVMGGKAVSGPEGAGASPAKGGELAAAGATKAEAAWRFSGKKPGSEVTDPAEWQDRKIRDLSMARMKHFEVIDPVEAPGLQGALSQAQSGAASGGRAPSVTISSVAGGVQRLTTQEGKQGWAPLKAGDTLSAGSAIRISQEGGEVGVTNLNAVLSLHWTLVQQTAKGKVYQLQGPK